MYHRDSMATVTNCTFSGNSAIDFGGGMFNTGNAGPTLADCTFCNNSPENIDGKVVLSGQIHLSTFCPIPVCPGDITGDGNINVVDLLEVLGAWGVCPP